MFDLKSFLGQLYGHLLFQERFSIQDNEWDALFEKQWFPFAALTGATISQMLNYIRSGWDVDELADRIVGEVKAQVPSMLERWKAHPSFAPHVPLLERGVERFNEDDYVSCTGLLYPRIEGIMRSNLDAIGERTTSTQSRLVEAAVAAKADRQGCLLLPHKFETYLKEVYFASFDPKDHDISVSRHSVSHGIASAAGFSAKSASIAILVIDQLLYLCEKGDTTEQEPTSAKDV